MLCCDDGQSSEDIPKVRLLFKDGKLVGHAPVLPSGWTVIRRLAVLFVAEMALIFALASLV